VGEPDNSWTVAQLKTYLVYYDIPYEPTALKATLLSLAVEHYG